MMMIMKYIKKEKKKNLRFKFRHLMKTEEGGVIEGGVIEGGVIEGGVIEGGVIEGEKF